MKLILGSKEGVNAKNKDYQVRIQIEGKTTLFNEDLISKILDETTQFQTERKNCDNYVLYGKIESVIDDALNFSTYSLTSSNYDVSVGYIAYYEPLENSLVDINSNGGSVTVTGNTLYSKDDVIILYKNKEDLIFTKVLDISGTDTKTLSLDFTGDTTGYKLIPSIADYKRVFKPLMETDYIKFYPSAFSVNIFGDEIHQFNTYKDIHLSGIHDNFAFPVTDLVFKFKLKTNTIVSKLDGNNIEDNVIDIVTFDLNNLDLQTLSKARHEFNVSGIDFHYNPYLLIKTRVYSNTVTNATQDTLFEYPSYAKVFNNGDVIFKKLLEVGYFEEGVNGVDYPYINNLHYIYRDIKFPVKRKVGVAPYTGIKIEDIQFDEELVNQEFGQGGRIC